MKQMAVSLLAVLAFSILAWPSGHAQAPISVPRVGVLGVGPHPDGGPLVGGLKEALRDRVGSKAKMWSTTLRSRRRSRGLGNRQPAS